MINISFAFGPVLDIMGLLMTYHTSIKSSITSGPNTLRISSINLPKPWAHENTALLPLNLNNKDFDQSAHLRRLIKFIAVYLEIPY